MEVGGRIWNPPLRILTILRMEAGRNAARFL